jgi:site-specific DNA recombinase
MKAALYARYSTELQSAASIEDQFRVCARLADRQGFTVVARFDDAAISGGTSQRPGYQALLAAARTHDYDVIIAEDTSRLWRQLPEQWRAVAELTDLGVHIVTQDIDTRSENFKLLLSVHGAMADVYRDQIGYRTRRGLEGRARAGKAAGGRAYGYLPAAQSPTAQIEIHSEQADTVRRIFQRYADVKSPRWIAAELNRLGVPSPGASWNRTSVRLNSKRRHGWVPTAIHGDHKRGTGILNNRTYVGEVVWGRSKWTRSAADSKVRRWHHVTDQEQIVRRQDERLRIVPDELWQRVKARQRSIEGATVQLRSVLKRNGRLPRYVLSELLTCEECGSTFRNVNGREFGCASHRDGGMSACTNDVRVSIQVAERKLLNELAEDMLSDEGVALFERRLREYLRAAEKVAKPPKRQSAGLAKAEAEIVQIRQLMKAGTLSPLVGQAAIDKAEEAREAFAKPERAEKDVTRVLRMLPNAARMLRERVRAGNAGVRSPRSIITARNTLFNMFGGKVPMRRAAVKPGERPYLIARVGLNRAVLLEAAGSCVSKVVAGVGFFNSRYRLPLNRASYVVEKIAF